MKRCSLKTVVYIPCQNANENFMTRIWVYVFKFGTWTPYWHIMACMLAWQDYILLKNITVGLNESCVLLFRIDVKHSKVYSMLGLHETSSV